MAFCWGFLAISAGGEVVISVRAIEMEVFELPIDRTLYDESFGHQRVQAFLLNL